MNTDRYRTLGGEGHGQLREKASRFIGIAFPIRNEDDFKSRLHAFMKEHHGARHFCHAWVMDDDGSRFRANDAGEPAGTAGKPILNRIRVAEMTWCGVIVVRYFGGTLLGKPGLVKAYGEAARLALQNAPVVERVACDQLLITCTYAQLENIRNVVMAHHGEIHDSVFMDHCNITASVPRSKVEELLRAWSAQGIVAVRQEVK